MKPDEEKPILSDGAIKLFKQQVKHSLNEYNKDFQPEEVDKLLNLATVNQDSPWNQNHPLAKLNRFLTFEICTLQQIQSNLTQYLGTQRTERKDLKKDNERLKKYRLSEVEKFQKEIEGMTMAQIMANKKLAKKLATINLDGL